MGQLASCRQISGFLTVDVAKSKVHMSDHSDAVLLTHQEGHMSAAGRNRIVSLCVPSQTGHLRDRCAGLRDRNRHEAVRVDSCPPPNAHAWTGAKYRKDVVVCDVVHGQCVVQPLEVVRQREEGRDSSREHSEAALESLLASSCLATWWHTLIVLA